MVSTEKVLERNRGWKRFTVGASKASFVYCVGRVSISASHKLLTCIFLFRSAATMSRYPFSGLVAALVVVFDQLALSGGVYRVYGTG